MGFSGSDDFFGSLGECNNRIFNNLMRSSYHSYDVYLTLFSDWLNLLTGNSRERAARAIDHADMGETFDDLLEDIQERGTTQIPTACDWLTSRRPDFCLHGFYI